MARKKTFDAEAVPLEFWCRDDVRLALARREVGRLFGIYLGVFPECTQTQLALLTEHDRSDISNFVRGTRSPRVADIDVLLRIADGLAMPDEARILLGLAPVGATVSAVRSGRARREKTQSAQLPKGHRFLVPPLEPALIDRLDEHNSLLGLVQEAAHADEVAVVAIAGPGGFGKTTLAAQLTHDDRIRTSFTDILWVETGEECTPARIVELISDLCVHMDGDRPALNDPEQAGFHLARIIADRRILLVIDNVWSAADLSPFLLGAPGCVRLVTTRNIRVCPSNAREFRLGPMSAHEVTELIARNVPNIGPSGTGSLADLCGGWPLLATVVGANLNHDLRAGAEPHQAIAFAAEALQSGGPQAFDVWDTNQRKNAIGHAISASVRSLEESVTINGSGDLRAAYQSLAAFPAATAIPISILNRWWQQSGWTTAAVRQFCRILADRSLISSYLADRDAVILHDIFRSYLRHLIAGQWSELHHSLVESMRPRSRSWADLDRNSSYIWRYLTYHLHQAKEYDELLDVLSSRDFVVAKAIQCGHSSLTADQQIIRAALSQGELTVQQEPAAQHGLTLTGAGYLLHGLVRAGDMTTTLEIILARSGYSVSTTGGQAGRSGDLVSLLGAAPARDMDTGHTGAIVSVCANGSTLISGGEDGIVRVWDLEHKVLLSQLQGHTGWVYATALSPDGGTIASAGEDGLIRLWDRATATALGSLPGHTGRTRSLSFTRDGQFLASGAEDGQILVWGVRNRTLVRRLATPGIPVWSLTLTADETMIAAGGEDEYVRLYDLSSGALLDEQAGHRDWIRSIAVCTKGDIVISGSGDGTVRTWDTSHRTLRPLHQFPNMTSRIRSVVTNSDASLIIAACEDATLRALRGGELAEHAAMPHGVDWIRTTTFAQTGAVIAGCEDGALRSWTPAAGGPARLIARGRNTVWSVVIEPHSGLAVLGHGNGTIDLCGFPSFRRQRTIACGSGRVWSLTANGGRIAAAGGDGAIRVWSVNDPDYSLSLNTEMRRSWAVSLSPDGSLIAGSDQRGNVRVWSLPTGILLWDQDVKAGRLRSLAFSGSGDRLAACGGDGTVRLWEPQSGTVVADVLNKSGWARSVALDHTAERVAVGTGTGEVVVHDLANERTIAELRGHTGRVLMLGFTANDDRLVSAAADGTACLWSVDHQAQLMQIRADTTGQCATFDLASSTLLLAGAGGVTHLKINRG